MPYIHVRVASPSLAPQQVQQLQEGVTRHMVDTLNKNGELTAVSIERVEPLYWSIAAKPQTMAAHVDAIISTGTGTSEQKAKFIAAVDGLLRNTLGEDLPLVCYVVVHEVPKDSWGYGGKTQFVRTSAQQ